MHGDITRAVKRVSDPEFLLKSVVNIADTSDVLEDNSYIQGIIALVEDKERWIRPLETWRVETYNPDEQFSDLVRHLLADYEVPRFMDNAWLDGNRVHQNWFKHIGAAGQNIRTASGLPFVLTKKAAHYFLTAPNDYTIAEALHWGQVHALGGDKKLAEALRGTYLVRALNRDTAPRNFWFVEEDFWISVIRFFIRNPGLNVRHVGPIIDYIQHQKYTDQRIAAEGETMGPPHPNFSMKGRTPEALLQQVGAWHLELHRAAEAQKKKIRQCRWKRSRIGAFRFQQGNRTWDITEITNQSELHAEGKIMGHCVLTYLELCTSGETSIWSMMVQDEGETVWKKVVTIAVAPRSRRITEVRGKFNRFPTQEEKSILERWATEENLKIPSYIRN